MKNQAREEPQVVLAAEKQMRAHARLAEITQQLSRHDEARSSATQYGPFLTVSREKGAGGGAIAEMVAQKLGWELLGRSLLDRIAERYCLSRPMLDVVDETKATWAQNLFGTWIDSRVISHEKYIMHLRQVIRAAAQCGRVVFVGRGAQFFLPMRYGLAVRIVAPETYRITQIARQKNIDEKQAARLIKEADEGRRHFVARYFRRNIEDPHLYDLVINVANHGSVAAANMIVMLCSEFRARQE